jgi:predicted phosphate transport protein (TIGR00153 family)
MKLLSKLMPREGQFFVLFNQHATNVVEGGRALTELLACNDDSGRRDALIRRIQELESAADRITHETASLLHSTFITPFDRDVIHRLISRMDDILDLIQDTAESLALYDIRALTAETRHLADLVRICCERVQSAVALLNNMDHAPEILRICHEIDSLESDADRVMRDGVSRLFRDEQDVRQIIKLKAVYELLETATDRCQDVADVIEGVVLENA